MTSAGFLQVSNVANAYGQTRVLDNISLDVHKGEFIALLGSSGCGKTTLLRTIAGFNAPTSGSISVSGQDITQLPPDKRQMALVFQSYALWPHMTVAQNIGYGLKLRKMEKSQIEARVAEMQDLLGLKGLGDRKPTALSGGQRQRVALGRALAISPEILLLDEPLSNLDARIRLTVRHELRALQKRLGITAIHVTHDREEAMVMADRIVILDAGRIAQQGRPEDVYNKPCSSFVAAFMGAENVLKLRGERIGDLFRFEQSDLHALGAVGAAGRPLVSGEVEARFRPEAAKLYQPTAQVPDVGMRFHGKVVSVSYPGGHWRHAVQIGEHEVMADSVEAYSPGDAVTVHVAEDALFLFNSPEKKPAH